MDSVMQFKGTIYEQGYGLIAQKVMRDPDLHATSKLIYSYICSFAAGGIDGERTAFPSIALQCHELGISEDTYYKYRKPLIDKGYLTITKQRKEKAKFNNNLYSIVAVPSPVKDEKTVKKADKTRKNEPYPNKSGMEPYPNRPSTVEPCTVETGTNNNILNNNILNNKKEEEEEIQPAEILSIMNEIISEREITNQKTIKAIYAAADKCKAKTLESAKNFVVKVVEEKMSKFGQKQQSNKKSNRRIEQLPEWFENHVNESRQSDAKVSPKKSQEELAKEQEEIQSLLASFR